MQHMPTNAAPYTNRLNTNTSMRNIESFDPTQLRPGEFRKKIQNYSFMLTDKIGKGYSSTVYKGLDDDNGNDQNIQVKKLQSKSLNLNLLKIKHRNQCFRPKLNVFDKYSIQMF